MINCVVGPYAVVGECYLAAPNIAYAEKYPRRKFGKNLNLRYSVSVNVTDSLPYHEFLEQAPPGFSVQTPIRFFEYDTTTEWGEPQKNKIEIWTFSSLDPIPVLEGGEPTVDVNLDKRTQVIVHFDIGKKIIKKEKKVSYYFMLKKVEVVKRPARISIPPNVRKKKQSRGNNGDEVKPQ